MMYSVIVLCFFLNLRGLSDLAVVYRESVVDNLTNWTDFVVYVFLSGERISFLFF